MSSLTALQTDSSIANETDSLGGGGFLVDSALYDCEVVLAYLTTSQGGAMALNIELKTHTKATVRQQFWMTSGTAKGCKNFYMVKDRKTGQETGEKAYLPGFQMANALALLTVGDDLANLETDKKVINLYNSDAKKELPTEVEMFTPLLKQRITAGILKQVVDKTEKDANGNYVPNGETRDVNEIDKLFRERDGLTVPEILAGSTESVFKAKWDEKNTGNTVNKAKGLSAAAAGVTAGSPAQATPAAGSPKSLFS